jgi:signal transduction histidine kinase
MTNISKGIAASALIILLGIGALSFRSTIRDEKDRDWVTHTQLVIEELQAILVDINRVETSQRGYILTGEERYAKPVESALAQVHQEIKEFRELTADNPRQKEAIERLEPLIAARIAGLLERMEIRRRGGLAAGARAVATGDNGEDLMNEIRGQIGAMRGTEDQLLGGRQRAAAASARKMKVVIVVGNIVAILILFGAGLAIHGEAVRRNLAELGLKQINEHLERRTSELSEANAEMESFSYSVAHDLRAPLRQISGYAGALIQDHGPSLDAEAQRYLEKVQEGARKMGQLVDDLLSLSRIGRQELVVQVTALDSLLRQVVDELEPECSGREVEWRIGDLFNAECDAGLMKQVFVNLLSNAVKYTRKREAALIEVGQMRQNGSRVIFIRDNGVGFEMEYVGKLFGVFQRLHKAQDFEGTGVGLAIVQRIIRKHGGRIWAEAKLNEGATFFFTLGSPQTGNPTNQSKEPSPEVINVTRS